MDNKNLLTSLISLLALLWLPSMCQSATVSESPQGMIEGLASSQRWAGRLAMALDIDIKPSSDNSGARPYGIKLVFHCDHQQRIEWLTQTSVEGVARVANDVINGEEMLRTRRDGEVWAKASLSRDYEGFRKLLCDNPEYGSALLGRIYGNNHLSIAELLRGAHEVQTRQEILDGEACTVIEAHTSYGSVTAWIAPNKGYNALKWEIRKASQDLFDESKIQSKSWLAAFHATELRRIEGYYIPIRSEFSLEIAKKDGGPAAIDLYHYTVKNVDLNPDFEALKAFQFNLPDGTPVSLREAPGIGYVWRNGRAVPDVEDEVVSNIDSLVSKAMEDTAPREGDTPSAPKQEPKPIVEHVKKEATGHAQDAPAVGWGLWKWVVVATGLLIIALFAIGSCLRRRKGTAA